MVGGDQVLPGIGPLPDLDHQVADLVHAGETTEHRLEAGVLPHRDLEPDQIVIEKSSRFPASTPPAPGRGYGPAPPQEPMADVTLMGGIAR